MSTKSKSWRAGRWYWYCKEQNRSLNWKDHWACGAVSRFTWATEEEADRAAARHGNRTCHEVGVSCIQPKNKRKARKVQK